MNPLFVFICFFIANTTCLTPKLSNNQAFKSTQSNKQWVEKVYKSGIKTVLIYKKGWDMSFPIISLDKDEQIQLVFDELGTKPGDYSWSLIHCNSSWEQDELTPIEYIMGFEIVDIKDIIFSQNTMTNYINYSLDIPAKNSQIIKSGNYIVKVFDRHNPENLILTRRFYVIEPIAEVSATVDQLRVNVKEGRNQRLNIHITINDTEISDSHESIVIKVIKNMHLEETFVNLKPSAISGNIFKYDNLSQLCFTGGHEYRHFDVKSIKFLSDRLRNIEKNENGNHIYLTADENRSMIPYNFKNDINGRKSIKLENNDVSNIMADYCNIYFQLDSEMILEAGDFYIYGALTDWNFEENNKMVYDFNAKRYTAKLFIKQGYYNYLYLFKTNDELFNSEQYMYKVEGNHFQTENDYQILIYYNDISMGYEKLVAYHLVNSSNSGKY